MPHPKWDERPLLLIVKTEASGLDCDAMLKFLEGKIVKWWLPDDVVFVSELPHTATGKLLKSQLREDYRDHILPTALLPDPISEIDHAIPGLCLLIDNAVPQSFLNCSLYLHQIVPLK